MNELRIFNSEEFGKIRTALIDSQPWFIAKDVSDNLGYAQTANMLKLIDIDDKKQIGSSEMDELNMQTSHMSIINESGLYAAIFGSKLPSAKKFKKWVTSEVLPTLRQTGTYTQTKLPQNPMELLDLYYKVLKQNQHEIAEVKDNVSEVKEELDQFKQDLPILGIEEDKITGAVRKQGVRILGGEESNAYKNKSIRGKLYGDIYRELKRQFGISTYKAIKRSQCDVAVQIIEAYQPPICLAEQITDCNAQMNMEVA